MVFFPQVSPSEPRMYLSSCPCYMPSPSHFSLFDHLNDVWLGVDIINLAVIYSSPLPFYLAPLEYPQPVFFPQCERPSFTPLQNGQLNLIHILFKVHVISAYIQIIRCLKMVASWQVLQMTCCNISLSLPLSLSLCACCMTGALVPSKFTFISDKKSVQLVLM